jgi:hypothetical protein
MFWFAITIVVVALVFDFLNGFHDAANSIATVVSTRVLSPRVAVVWAACFPGAIRLGWSEGLSPLGQGVSRFRDCAGMEGNHIRGIQKRRG